MGIIPGLLNYSAMPELSGTVHGTIGDDMLAHITYSCSSNKVLFTTHCKDLTIPDFVDLLLHHYQ